MKRTLIWLSVLLLLLAACSPTSEPAAETAVSDAATTEDQDDHEDGDDHDDHEDGDDHDDHEDGDDHDHEDGDDHDHDKEDGDDHDHDHEDGDEHDHDDHGDEEGAEALMLPELEAAALDGSLLQVVATTSIIGDVVAQVGGDAIELTTLMGPGQDPHSFEPAARDLTAVSTANVIFVNGWGLEETLVRDLEEIGEAAPLVAISAGIAPIEFGEDGHDHGHEGEGEHEDEHEHEEEGEHEDEHEGEDEHEHEDEHDHGHSGADPHVWFDVHNVEQWVANVAQTLSTLDPSNADTFAANAAAYVEELEALEAYIEEQVEQIPAENRLLVTNHDALGYFASEYGFEVIGTVIPSLSTLAEPSASDLAGLIEEMEEHSLCTIFTETTVSDSLAQTVAGELSGCDDVQVLPIYTGAIGAAGSNADSYIGMFRANVDNIVAGLAN